MEQVPYELRELLSDRLKLGDLARPVTRVEVDRMAFIPGRIEQLDFVTTDFRETTEIVKEWIDGVESDAETLSTSVDITFPLEGYSVDDINSHYRTSSRPGHDGVDIACPVGVTVLSAWAGKVVDVCDDWSNDGGYYINILHSNGIMTRYLHNSKTFVSKDDWVEAGEPIALAGNTGSVASYHGKVWGAPNDPNGTRIKGWGSHLHFEIHEGANEHTNWSPSTAVNPVPYLEKKKAIYTVSSNIGTGNNTEDTIKGYVGETVFWENFSRRDWKDLKNYQMDFNSLLLLKHEKGFGMSSIIDGGQAVFNFYPSYKVDSIMTGFVTGFNFWVDMKLPGAMNVKFSTDFDGTEYDEFRVFVNDKLVRRFKRFSHARLEEEINDIPIPQGDEVKIRMEMKYAGTGEKKFSFNNIIIKEINPTPPKDDKTKDNLDPTVSGSNGHWELVEQKNFVYSEKPEKVDIQVGQFVYMDTMPLPNVISLEVDRQYEQEASEATITVSNPDGFFSPDYNPFYFPETYRGQSPWSYNANGYQIGVLSENTPIRIYIGYGLNQVRLFTGLIDKVDMSGEGGTLTINCRDMYKRLIHHVLRQEKVYGGKSLHEDNTQVEKTRWLKSSVVQDLVVEAGLTGWRANEDDLNYPDLVLEESYMVEMNAREGYIIKPDPDNEGLFKEVPVNSIPSPWGWLNPFVDEDGRKFYAWKTKVNEAISEVIKDTNYRSYCDRYGTFRLETIDLDKPVVDTFTEDDNMVSIDKSIDMSRARSHLVIFDSEEQSYANFVDKELLMELKGEVRTATVKIPWAKTKESKRKVAERMFFDMKRLCRTLQVSIPGNPTLDVLDRVYVKDSTTTTRSVYTIKGIRDTFDVNNGYLQVIDLTWSAPGVVV